MFMYYFRRLSLIIFVISFLCPGLFFQSPSFVMRPAHSATTDSDLLKSYVSNIMDKVLDIVNSDMSSRGKHGAFKNLISVELDIRRTALFTLGRYGRSVKSSDRMEFYRLFNDHLARIFLRYTDRLVGADFEIYSVHVRNAKDVIVSGRISFKDGRLPLDVKWRLYTGGDEIQIFDINIDGIWLALQQRSDFTSFLKNNKGDIKPLLDRLSSMRSQ